MVDELPAAENAAEEDAAAPGPGTSPHVASVPDGDALSARSSSGVLHVASGADSDGVAALDDEVERLLVSADLRDAVAGHRDLHAREQSPEDLARLAGISREWAARDRDLAAADRADLISLLRTRAGQPGIPRPR